MKAIIIVESWFGNTRQVGDAVAEALQSQGYEVTITSVAEAPVAVGSGTDLLVLGMPTQALGMSTPGTRENAAKQSGRPVTLGMREWIESARIPDGASVAVFDTKTGGGWLTGSAAKAAARALSKRMPKVVVLPPQSFIVQGTQGPLRDGQIAAAAAWGEGLVGNDSKL